MSLVPCYAGRTASPIDVTKSLDFADMCKQRHVLYQFPEAIKNDGLSHKLEKGSKDLMMNPRHPHFQDTPEALDQALVNEFVANKKHAMQTALGMGCVHYGCDFLTIVGTALATGLNQVAGAFAIAKGATTTKEAIETGVRKGFRIAHMENDVRFRYECEYVKRRRFLPKDLRKAIEFKLSATYQCDETNLIPTLETISKVLNIPTKSFPPKKRF